jgi:tRNA-2-methylthio-N6-dimethylallyladenosine synthase
VHFAPGGETPRPGDIVTTRVTSTAPHYLRADDAPLEVRRTRAGDAWETRQRAAEASAPEGPAPVLLGMPSLRG